MSKSLFIFVHRLMPVLILLATGNFSYGQEAPLSLYADRKARGKGDMVTVLITETANASRQSQVQKSGDNTVDAAGKVEGNLLQFLPVFGLKSNIKTNSNSKEGTAQRDLLTGRISAVITQVTDNGLFKITGSKVINVNGERNLMTIKGTIRPRDIRWDNTIFSYNVADARIFYSEAGIRGKLAQRGSFERLANLIMGGAGLAIIGYVGGISALAIIRSFSP